MTSLLRLFQSVKFFWEGIWPNITLKTIFFLFWVFFWQLLNKITSKKTRNLKTFVILRQKEVLTYVQKVLERYYIPTGLKELLTGKMRLYVPRRCGWWVATQKFRACSVALWNVRGGYPPLLPMSFWFLLCKEFLPSLSIKKKNSIWVFFYVNNPPVLVI